MRPTVIAVGILAALAVALLSSVAGHEFHFSVLYFLPVGLFAWHGGRRRGLAMAAAAAVLSFISARVNGHEYQNPISIYANAADVLAGTIAVALLVARLSRSATPPGPTSGDPVEIDAAFARATMRKIDPQGKPRRR